MKVISFKNREGKFTLSLLGTLILLMVCMTILTGCRTDDDNETEPNGKDEICDNALADGYRTVTVSSDTREYILYVPSSYDDNSPTPLILNFHGFGGCVSSFATDVGEGTSDLHSVADNGNFIIAYPQGVERTKGGAEWDPGDNGEQNIMNNDVYFVEQLIADINNDYNIDPMRIYATGYSNGGMMAYGLACTKSNVIAAVGIMSGVMLDAACDVNEYTSVIHFHGIEDDVLPYDGNQDFQSIADVIDFWLNHNNIPSSNLTTTQLNGGDVVKEEYTGGSGNTSVELYTINEEYEKPGGHVWFSGDIEGVSPNQILWDFLSSYRLDD